MLDYVFSCLHDTGGFGAAPGHDAHMLYTVSGVQILATLDAFDDLDRRVDGGRAKIGKCKTSLRTRDHLPTLFADLSCPDITGLQDRNTGSFAGDRWGEIDTRFTYGAFNALSLLGLTHLIDVDAAVNYIQACVNFDGAYGASPGGESHAGQVFTCVGALAIAGRLDLVDKDKLGGWLSERQLPGGGLNGRPEKLEDVCYSWWVVSSLAMIGRLHWISKDKLTEFILKCQVSGMVNAVCMYN